MSTATKPPQVRNIVAALSEKHQCPQARGKALRAKLADITAQHDATDTELDALEAAAAERAGVAAIEGNKYDPAEDTAAIVALRSKLAGLVLVMRQLDTAIKSADADAVAARLCDLRRDAEGLIAARICRAQRAAAALLAALNILSDTGVDPDLVHTFLERHRHEVPATNHATAYALEELRRQAPLGRADRVVLQNEISARDAWHSDMRPSPAQIQAAQALIESQEADHG